MSLIKKYNTSSMGNVWYLKKYFNNNRVNILRFMSIVLSNQCGKGIISEPQRGTIKTPLIVFF